MYWLTDPGDVVLDPMAGTGVLAHTLEAYRFFREAYEADGSGPRQALMSDLAPTRPDIIAADARRKLPFAKGDAKLAILDPPYLRIADGKGYQNLGKDLDRWLSGLEKIVRNIRCHLRADGGRACADRLPHCSDVVRKRFCPAGHYLQSGAEFRLVDGTQPNDCQPQGKDVAERM
jgi:hypothetical protein